MVNKGEETKEYDDELGGGRQVVVVGVNVGGVVVEFDAESSEHGEGKRGDGECFVVEMVMLYVCKGGEREEADGEEREGRQRREQEGEEEVGEKVGKKGGGTVLKGVGEEDGQVEHVESSPGSEGRT